MMTLEQLDRLEKYIYLNRKGDQPIAEVIDAFHQLPKYPQTKPMLEFLEDTSYQYCEAIRRYLLGPSDPLWIDEQDMFSIMGAKKIVVPWGKAPRNWPHI